MQKNQAGETLLESLASILILTFASILLLTLVSTAKHINQSAKETDRAFFRQLVDVELAREEQGISGTVTVTVNGSTQSAAVEVFGGESLTAWYVEDGQ